MLSKIRQSILENGDMTFEETLSNLCSMRNALQNMKLQVVSGKLPQPQLTRRQIFSLEKHGAIYYKKRLSDAKLFCANGHYIFIVPCNSPYQVLCAQLNVGLPGSRARRQEEGHTSFENESSVYFAGVMQFQEGRLIYWNNASGHFSPPPEYRYHLIPYVRLLLPEVLFREYGQLRFG